MGRRHGFPRALSPSSSSPCSLFVIPVLVVRHPRARCSSSPCSLFVIPVLVTGINRGMVLTLIPVTSTGMTDRMHGMTDWTHENYGWDAPE